MPPCQQYPPSQRAHGQAPHRLRIGWRRVLWAVLAAAAVGTGHSLAQDTVHVTGVVWQPHGLNLQPQGDWDRLGAHQLLVQWQAVNDTPIHPPSDTPDAADSASPPPTHWQRIGQAPWAQQVFLGLAGRFEEADARAQAVTLARASANLSKAPKGLNVVGWYFPVEFDPTWAVPPELVAALAALPRPLWVSLYDNTNTGAPELVAYLERWLPPDVGVFWQDGVGVHARSAQVAVAHATALAEHLGTQRLKIIAEAFRPTPSGGFRPATVEELRAQLAHYTGFEVFLFEGPTYVPTATVSGLLAQPLRQSAPPTPAHWVGDQ